MASADREASRAYKLLGRRGAAAPRPPAHRLRSQPFGTNEFEQFCRLIGGQPYLAANVRSFLPTSFIAGWSTAIRRPEAPRWLKAAPPPGIKEPFNVRYWGVGNESWGCGGNFTPQEYAVEFRRYTTWVPVTGRTWRSSPPGPTATTATGLADFSRKSRARAKIRFMASTGWRCTTMRGT